MGYNAHSLRHQHITNKLWIGVVKGWHINTLVTISIVNIQKVHKLLLCQHIIIVHFSHNSIYYIGIISKSATLERT